MSGYGRPLVLDWSAYTRVLLARERGPSDRRLSAEALARFAAAVVSDELYVCAPFRLEALYCAQSPPDYDELSAELQGFRVATADADTWDIAQVAQRQLAHAPRVSHRVELADLLVATIAHQNGLGVLHYDHDYDSISRHGGLAFDAVWIAPAGSVD